jgi:hypothetical protein
MKLLVTLAPVAVTVNTDAQQLAVNTDAQRLTGLFPHVQLLIELFTGVLK